jgi:cell division protein FtsB
MSGPSQRAAERRSAPRGPSARPRPPAKTGRTGSATGASTSTRPRASRASTALSAVRDRPSLTGRAVILAGVLALLVFTLAVPVRELIHQRTEINGLRTENAAAQTRVDALVVRQERLQDPAYVTSLIRERLHYVLPGEVGYVVLDPSEAPAPTTAKKVVPVTAWYATLWSAVSAADGAAAPAAPAGVPVRPNAPR